MAKQHMGTLYGLGVGPGDPKLITIKAVEVLAQVEVVFAAGSSKNDYSIAQQVVAPHLPPKAALRKLEFPMTSDKEQLARAWQENAEQVLAVLKAGQDAAFITIGDPLTYSTYIYLMNTVRELAPKTPIQTVAGVTAYQAAAARLNRPLVQGKEALMIVSGVADPAELPGLAACAENLVIMKAYRNLDRLLEAVAELPEPMEVSLVSNCGLAGERLEADAFAVKGEKVPYLSMLIAKRRNEA